MGLEYSESVVRALSLTGFEDETYVRPIVPVGELWKTSEIYLAGWQAAYDCIKLTPDAYTLEVFPSVPAEIPVAYAGDWLSGWMDACRFDEVPDLDWKEYRPEHPGLSESEFYMSINKK
jgi:hypothetical protein